MLNKHILVDAALVTTLVIGLAACGGSSSGDVAAVSTGAGAGTSTEQVPSGDSFVARVLAFITGTSETTEPQAVDGIPPSTPEDTEAQPVS